MGLFWENFYRLNIYFLFLWMLHVFFKLDILNMITWQHWKTSSPSPLGFCCCCCCYLFVQWLSYTSLCCLLRPLKSLFCMFSNQLLVRFLFTNYSLTYHSFRVSQAWIQNPNKPQLQAVTSEPQPLTCKTVMRKPAHSVNTKLWLYWGCEPHKSSATCW